MRVAQIAIACVVVVTCFVEHADASFLTFTDRASWRTAAGGGTGNLTENFNSFVADDPYPATAGFLTFTAGGLGVSDYQRIDVVPFTLDTSSVDGSPYAFLRTAGRVFDTAVDFTPLAAIGFDYINSNLSGDMDFTTSLGDSSSVPDSTTVAFFGLVYDAGETITSLEFIDSDNLTYKSDNWEAYSAVSSVPEPSSLALFGISSCIAGVGAARRRRRGKHQVATA